MNVQRAEIPLFTASSKQLQLREELTHAFKSLLLAACCWLHAVEGCESACLALARLTQGFKLSQELQRSEGSQEFHSPLLAHTC